MTTLTACLCYQRHELNSFRSGADQALHCPRTENILQQTALPPAGVLQSSCSLRPHLRVDFLASSDTPVNVGDSPTTQQREAAVDATGADCASSAGPPVQQPPRSEYAGNHSSSGRHWQSLSHVTQNAGTLAAAAAAAGVVVAAAAAAAVPAKGAAGRSIFAAIGGDGAAAGPHSNLGGGSAAAAAAGAATCAAIAASSPDASGAATGGAAGADDVAPANAEEGATAIHRRRLHAAAEAAWPLVHRRHRLCWSGCMDHHSSPC